MLEERIHDLRPSIEKTDALLLETDKATGISTLKHQVTKVVVAYRPTSVLCRCRAYPCMEMPPPPLEDKV
jgi:hypothetical protein